MLVYADQPASGLPNAVLEALGRAVASAAERPTLVAALDDLAAAVRTVCGADVALVRAPADGGALEAVAVAGPPALAAELEGTRLESDGLPAGTVSELSEAPAAVRRAAARAGAEAVLVVPVRGGGRSAALELYRSGGAFEEQDRLAAELAAGQIALVLRAFAGGDAAGALGLPSLELAGEALAATAGGRGAAETVALVAALLVGAPVGLVWELEGGALVLTGSHGLPPSAGLDGARRLAQAALAEPEPVRLAAADGLPGGSDASVALPLGRPRSGVLQLLVAAGSVPAGAELARLEAFAVRAAHALRAQAGTRALEVELERTRALLAVVGEASAQLSLSHTLEAVVDRIVELVDVERVAVYLRADEQRLVPAVERGLSGPHARVAERLLELAFGPRGGAVVVVRAAARDRRLAVVANEAGIGAALAAPLVAGNEVVGLLAVYPERSGDETESVQALLGAVAGQLAVAVQNAQLHERATELGRELEAALSAEREAARRLGALYEISRSFAQELSLDKTLAALARTIVDVLDVDAAMIAMPDERRELLTLRALHVTDAALAEPVRAILERPQSFGDARVQQLFRAAAPFHLPRGHALLEPFLARGWTGAVVPVATPVETIAALTLLSFRPGSPIGSELVDDALAIAGQAALAIDNARLYQQQKQFADTMQRSLLPRARPAVPGLEVGEVYESSARVDVGGDLYDFLELADGRLAVVLGDVTGHGVEATADMAMAKFVFRSLAREHPEPGDFLSAANDVVVDEIAPGKFITMTYLAVDPADGMVACASAGHPPPRVVSPNGVVTPLDARGLVLGIDPGGVYGEVQAKLPPGASVVLYTDGVVEARSGEEQYGTVRLDRLLSAQRELPAGALARAVTEDARRFAGGEISDDLAVVVIRRVG